MPRAGARPEPDPDIRSPCQSSISVNPRFLRAAASSAPVIRISVYKQGEVEPGNDGGSGLEQARAPNDSGVPVSYGTRTLSTGYPASIDNTIPVMLCGKTWLLRHDRRGSCRPMSVVHSIRAKCPVLTEAAVELTLSGGAILQRGDADSSDHNCNASFRAPKAAPDRLVP